MIFLLLVSSPEWSFISLLISLTNHSPVLSSHLILYFFHIPSPLLLFPSYCWLHKAYRDFIKPIVIFRDCSELMCSNSFWQLPFHYCPQLITLHDSPQGFTLDETNSDPKPFCGSYQTLPVLTQGCWLDSVFLSTNSDWLPEYWLHFLFLISHFQHLQCCIPSSSIFFSLSRSSFFIYLFLFTSPPDRSAEVINLHHPLSRHQSLSVFQSLPYHRHSLLLTPSPTPPHHHLHYILKHVCFLTFWVLSEMLLTWHVNFVSFSTIFTDFWVYL